MATEHRSHIPLIGGYGLRVPHVYGVLVLTKVAEMRAREAVVP